MGGGAWDSHTYRSRTSSKAAAGYSSSFTHDEDIRTGRVAVGLHESVDPKKVAGPGSPNEGKVVREAFDSDDHPHSVPIAVIFDVTGSMGGIPRVLQQKLPNLHGLLQRKGYVEDPQILFGAVGDAYSDRVPLQLGQFESDNRGDEQLENFYLEGGGGGGNHESYNLAAYYMARHTDIDAIKKRDQKGYLFFIGDERIYSALDASHIKQHIDPKSEITRAVKTTDIFDELKERFHVFFLFAAQGSYREGDVLDASLPDKGGWGGSLNDQVCYWRDLLGQNALTLEDADAVCETIGLTIGVMEGTVTLEDGMDDLADVGSDRKSIEAAGKALATIGATAAPVATATGSLPDTDDPADSGTERL